MTYELITVDEAARRLAVSTVTVEWLVHSGRLAGHDGPSDSLERPQLVDAADIAAIRGEALERLHGCDTRCVRVGTWPWLLRLQRGWYFGCLSNCVATGFGAGRNRWVRRLGWRLAGGDPSQFPGPRGGPPGGWSREAWLGCLLPIAVVVLLGALVVWLR